MKVISLILVIICCGLALDVDDEKLLKKYQDFTKKYGIKFNSENHNRLNTYKKNQKKIIEHNNQIQKTYKMGENFFTDMDFDEIKKSYMGLKVNKNNIKKSSNVSQNSAQPIVSESLPVSKDWRQMGAITAVKNQGTCNSCWSFAPTAAIEAYYKLTNNASVDLSEQSLVNCVPGGCASGYIDKAFKYVIAKGISYESDCPYQARNQTCSSIPENVVKCNDYDVLPTGDETKMKEHVALKGPVVACMHMSSNFIMYESGVFFDSSCTQKANHAVLVVGYGVEDGQEYWLAKNSFGTGWGEEGYVKMARNNGSHCGIASYVAYPML